MWASPSHPVACYNDAIFFLKLLNCVIIETPMVIAMGYLCIQTIKGNWLCLLVFVLLISKRQKEGKEFYF